ncbi:MAG: hypothetical protein IJ540_07385 [Prevotella sp.]|nr:hypothetical protein [Prevotella sp.]
MMKVVFLDFDGVMDTAYYDHVLAKEGKPHNDEYGCVFDPNCIKNLKHIIDQTGADIVVTSSWKYLMSYQDFLNMWKDRDLPGFVTDVTPEPPNRRNRGDEIDAWIEECHTDCQYVIIDDLGANNFNEHQIPRLLIVNPFVGLDEDVADKAITLLNSLQNREELGYKGRWIEQLRSYCANRWPEGLGKTHGVEHWDRVAKFGRILHDGEADMDVIMAFAYLHDSERIDNAEDKEHGLRASRLTDTIRKTMLANLNDEQIEKLKRACELHTIQHKTGDVTIDACFDADRMDLFRVGIKPSPERMATKRGAELVADPYYEAYYNEITCIQ